MRRKFSLMKFSTNIDSLQNKCIYIHGSEYENRIKSHLTEIDSSDI